MANDLEYFEIRCNRFKRFIDENKIKETVTGIARRINTDYEGKELLFIVVLRGAIFFAVDLMRCIDVKCEMETISASSYGDNLISSGRVELDLKKIDVKDKHVIVVEDIIDTGLTLIAIINKLREQKPKSLEIASFLSKPSERQSEIYVKYLGLEIPPVFAIGYGLDYAGQGRNLTGIYGLDV